jgi:sec-independent protein translocase protein TatB
MFGIGLPELILIFALALIVVGPDKLPDLARSVAKGVMDLKKTANTLKESLSEHGNPLDDIKPELEDAAKAIRDDVMMDVGTEWKDTTRKKEESKEIIDVDPKLTSIETVENTEKKTDTSDQTEQKN